ncbi:hypothetical protein CTI12_AA516070 [Artemisia annua]|uniref:Zinc knuckle CX2CX4HX4C n=1 Tax=Artemisia annua TaxID=35608 RepID=A0A2U1L323_ARTAN|nr:hypothetical protein CTI12_AA516070 [Artemisia annua]
MCHNGTGRLGFARVLVEVDAAKEVQYKDAMNHTKKVKFVKVEYSWKPEVCNHCVVFGHSFKDCKVRLRTVVEVERDRHMRKDQLKYGNTVQNQVWKGGQSGQNFGRRIIGRYAPKQREGTNERERTGEGNKDQLNVKGKENDITKDIVDGMERKDETDKGNNYEKEFPALGPKEGRSKPQSITQRENKNRFDVMGSEGNNETLDTNVNQECQDKGDVCRDKNGKSSKVEMVGMFVDNKRIPNVEESKQWAEYMFGWYKEKWRAKWKNECPI